MQNAFFTSDCTPIPMNRLSGEVAYHGRNHNICYKSSIGSRRASRIITKGFVKRLLTIVLASASFK